MTASKSSSATVSRPGLAAISGRDRDRTVVWLGGEHDLLTVASLSATMARAIALDEADLVLDLSDVDFMGAATVGVIVRGRTLLRLRSRSLALRSPSRSARRVIELCGLAALLEPPSLLEAAAMSDPSAALATWVAVPATGRADRPVLAPLQEPVARTSNTGARAGP
jgi:anti-sigma B factor antagonist